MSVFLVIPNLHVQRANMLQAPYLYAPAPVFAAVMAAHALGKRSDTLVDGVGIVHQRAEPIMDWWVREGRERTWLNVSPVQFRGASWIGERSATTDYASTNKRPQGLAIQPTMTSHLELSLVLRVTSPNMAKVERQLRHLRLAGGVITHFGKPSVHETLAEALHRIHGGYWVEEAMDVVEQRRKQGMDPITAVLTRGEGEWLVPVNLGFSVISSFEPRSGTRRHPKTGETLLHAYADNAIGLVRYVSLGKIRQRLEEGGALPLWRYRWRHDRLFVVHQSA